ncbi:MAG: ATP-dependent Clp protease adaptor ClpS, partial [SAR324 cluster bacterium]|nr:ATP-dependent Clp protease adaptor ClpS [SAR324 cluster bacterium]
GQGLCGLYTREIAETKVAQVHKIAEASGHPLRAIMERD